MICICCLRKLPPIKEDKAYSQWSRKFHKKCYKDKDMWLNILTKYQKQFGTEANPETIEQYSRLAGLKMN